MGSAPTQTKKGGLRRLRLQAFYKFLFWALKKLIIHKHWTDFILITRATRLFFFAFLKDPSGAAVKWRLRLSALTDKKNPAPSHCHWLFVTIVCVCEQAWCWLSAASCHYFHPEPGPWQHSSQKGTRIFPLCQTFRRISAVILGIYKESFYKNGLFSF